MPYIEREQRSGAELVPMDPGELNFAITKLCLRYLERKGEVRYARINEVIGAMECAKQEFYRRVAVPYEDVKRQLNGDVYDLKLE